MNYSKIYEDFIASRRERESFIVGYSEKHHILPRALGGGNEKSNMIRLTPDDHIHAHILLARIYGGMMWSAVHFMLKKTIGRTRSVKRIPSKDEVRAVSFARRMHALHCVGENASRYGKPHTAETRLKMRQSHKERNARQPTWKQLPENKIKFSGDNHWTRNQKNPDALARALPKFIANLKLATASNIGDGNCMRRPEIAKKVSAALRQQYAAMVGVGSANAIANRNAAHRTKEYREKARNLLLARKVKLGGACGDNPNSRKVRCIETGIIFNSVKEACIFCGGDVTKACANGGRAGGYHWERIGTHAADGRVMKNGA